MRPLRATSLPKGEREIRVWTGFGLGIPHDLYRLRVSGKNMRGALILWWSHDGEWGPSDAPESMHAYVRRVFGCERIRQHEQADTCEGDFGRRPPDWRRVLARMDSLGVNTLQTPAGDPLVFDGYHIVVRERLEGHGCVRGRVASGPSREPDAADDGAALRLTLCWAVRRCSAAKLHRFQVRGARQRLLLTAKGRLCIFHTT